MEDLNGGNGDFARQAHTDAREGSDSTCRMNGADKFVA